MAKTSLNALLVAAALCSTSAIARDFVQTNLVSDGMAPAAVIDHHLVNPWGVAYAATGPFWVSDAGTGLATLYDGFGAIQPLIVTIPAPLGDSGPSLPTGQVFNATPDFQVMQAGKSGAAAFLFATISGTISGWSLTVDPANAIIAVDSSVCHAAYLGLTLYKKGQLHPCCQLRVWDG